MHELKLSNCGNIMCVVMKVLQDKGAIHSVNEGSSFPLPHLHSALEAHFCSFSGIIRVHIPKHIPKTAWQAAKSPNLHYCSAKQTTFHDKEKKHFPMEFSFTWNPLSISCKALPKKIASWCLLCWNEGHPIWSELYGVRISLSACWESCQCRGKFNSVS